MEKNKRTCVVAAIYTLVTQKCVNSVYDSNNGEYFLFSCQCSFGRISIYDYKRNNYMQGDVNQLFDYSTSSYISVQINGDSFSGYDYEKGNYFNGSINGNNIILYDYEYFCYFNYYIS